MSNCQIFIFLANFEIFFFQRGERIKKSKWKNVKIHTLKIQGKFQIKSFKYFSENKKTK